MPRAKLSRAKIEEAIQCPRWQEFREALKQFDTYNKVIALYAYQQQQNHSYRNGCCTQDTVDVQVLNYLNALARGGLIEPLSGSFQLERHWYDAVTLKERRI